MSFTVTDRLSAERAAKQACSVFFPAYEEWSSCYEQLITQSQHKPESWIDIKVPIPEAKMSFRSTEIIIPETRDVFVPRTPLGKKLLSLRVRAIKAGMKLLSADEVLEQLKRRREEHENNEADVC